MENAWKLKITVAIVYMLVLRDEPAMSKMRQMQFSMDRALEKTLRVESQIIEKM